jgi:hypothetical protein
MAQETTCKGVGTLHGDHDLPQGDVLRASAQTKAAPGAPMGFQNAVVSKVLEDLGEERPREMEVLGQVAGEPIGAVIRKPDQGLEGVPRWRVE